MRIVFAMTAGIGCAIIGGSFARSLVLREETLAAWLRVIDQLIPMINYVDDPLPDVLARLISANEKADEGVVSAFHIAAERMRKNPALTLSDALPDTWRANLEPADAQSITPLLLGLGKTERASQVSQLETIRAQVASQQAFAKERTGKQQRLYRSLGTLGGLALFLCLIG